jgi:hypothetical protein
MIQQNRYETSHKLAPLGAHEALRQQLLPTQGQSVRPSASRLYTAPSSKLHSSAQWQTLLALQKLQNAPCGSRATSRIALELAHDFSRLLQVRMRRRQRRLKYAQRLARHVERSMNVAEPVVAEAYIEKCNT